MSFTPVQPSSPLNNNLNQINKMVAQLNKEQTTKIFKGANNTNAVTFGKIGDNEYGVLVNDGTHNRVILGKFPDGTYGLAISKEGYDVLDIMNE